jgi:hypothetical protein
MLCDKKYDERKVDNSFVYCPYESKKRLVPSYLRAARYEDSESAFRKAEMPGRRRYCALDAD